LIMEKLALSELLGDLVVYRRLEPCDGRLQGWRGACIPRKTEPAYAQAIVDILGQAQALRSSRPLERLVYIGDTIMNDGQAVRNLTTHLPTRGFIAQERMEEPKRVRREGSLMVANRWSALVDFLSLLRREGFALDQSTAALIDLDKTAFGARGRNDAVIDEARVEAVRRTVEEVLGAEFRGEEFRSVYGELNRPEYHPFTADNQDYLAYICLMISGGVYPFDELLADLEAGRLRSFAQFIEACSQRPIGEGLLSIHREVYANFRAGDPTPFKSFRYREYEETVARMDRLPADADVDSLLAEEIVLTREVVDAGRFLAERGVLLFGLTDKPDEASLPRPELRRKGYLPLHRVRVKVVGESIYEDLARFG